LSKQWVETNGLLKRIQTRLLKVADVVTYMLIRYEKLLPAHPTPTIQVCVSKPASKMFVFVGLIKLIINSIVIIANNNFQVDFELN